VTGQPRHAYTGGESVEADFSVTGDGGPLLPSYLLVEERDGAGWTTLAHDGDGTTTIEWRRGDGQTVAHATWRVPTGTAGTRRLTYIDVDSRTSTREFTVTS
jgi:neutral ceramidase